MLKTLSHPSELSSYLNTRLYKAFKAEVLRTQRPDLHLIWLENEPLAHCSVWWQSMPNHDQRLAYIGHYAALDDRAGKALLDAACQLLKEQGCELAIGPIDGSTWRNYRFVSEGDAPAFFLEPSNPKAYPQQWQNAGFLTLASYYSVLQTDLNPAEHTRGCLAKLKSKGIEIRQLNREKLDAELEAIFELSLKSFAQNFLYTPISKDEFIAQYTQVLPYLKDELVLVAETKDQALGFIFALPDLAQQMRGETLDTFIIKTLATHPDYGGQGIASCLTALCIERARALGFKKAIHALMLETNRSRQISNHYEPQVLRRYQLFSKTL